MLFTTELRTRCTEGEDKLAEDEAEMRKCREDEVTPETNEGADDRGEEVEGFRMSVGVVGGRCCRCWSGKEFGEESPDGGKI